jgi:hypothetical protein
MDLKLYTILLVWLQGRSFCTTFVPMETSILLVAGSLCTIFVGDFNFFGLALGQAFMDTGLALGGGHDFLGFASILLAVKE